MKRGIFITLEGGEGVGKTTNIEWLDKYLKSRGHDVLRLYEPGGTELGEELRHLIKRVDFASPVCEKAELLLFCASRAQLVHQVIEPALEEGKIIICDRFADSTLAYQGVARSIPLEEVSMINNFAKDSLQPDLTILLDLDPETGFQRIHQGRHEDQPDRMEMQSRKFYEDVRRAYLTLAQKEPERFCIVNAAPKLEDVQEEIRKILERKFHL